MLSPNVCATPGIERAVIVNSSTLQSCQHRYHSQSTSKAYIRGIWLLLILVQPPISGDDAVADGGVGIGVEGGEEVCCAGVGEVFDVQVNGGDLPSAGVWRGGCHGLVGGGKW